MLVHDNLGNNIRKQREIRNWTQEELAHQSGLTLGTISKIERSRSNPTVKTVDKIADAFGIETETLFHIS